MLPRPSSSTLFPYTTLFRSEYEFVLQAGQYARFWISQKTINIAVTFFAPSGTVLYQGDAARIGEVELADLIADASGTYRIKITDRKSTRLNSSHVSISYAVF